MTCVVVARNGEGDPWVFGSLPEARQHPIPQMDDVYATSADELVAEYGRGHADSLLRFAGDRDRSRLSQAIVAWRSAPPHSVLPPEHREFIWVLVVKAAKKPPRDPAEIVRIVTEDRAHREGRTLRSLPGASARSSSAVPDKESSMAEPKKPRVPDNSVINITLPEGVTNPKRAGTPSADRFALYKDGMTVKAAKEAGVKAADISYDSDKGFIKLTEGEPETAAAS